MRTAVGTRGADTGADSARWAGALDRNDTNYRWLVEWLHGINARQNPETALECVRAVADFAAYQHPGRFADGAVENIAFEIGCRLAEVRGGRGDVGGGRALASLRPDGRRHVVHVVTQIETIGGGTRALERWVRIDGESRHTVVATNQGREPLHPGVEAVVAANGGAILRPPPDAALLDRAWFVRTVARVAADLVVVHHHVDDVVPTVAFAEPGGPPVAVVNDADHMFWLGSTATDAVINWRSLSTRLSERRFVRRDHIIPLPLDDTRTVPAGEARRQLGIPDDQVMVLSIGRGPKYRPDSRRNFFRTACTILERNPAAHIYVVGVTAAEATPHLTQEGNGRLHLLGPQKDPSLFQAAADVYIEGFPFGSQTALLETALAGVPAVAAYDPPCKLLVTDDDPVENLLVTPRDEADYVERAGALIRDPDERRRLGGAFRDRLLAAHTGDGWSARLRAVYAALESVPHRPGRAGVTECGRTGDDLALSTWHDDLSGGAPGAAAWRAGDHRSRMAFDVAYRLRQRGCYRAPSRLLLKALRAGGGRRKLVTAMGKLSLHWLSRQVGFARRS